VTVQIKAIEQYFHVVLLIMLHKVVQLSSLWMKPRCVTIQMKAEAGSQCVRNVILEFNILCIYILCVRTNRELLLGLSKGKARVEIPASFYFFVQWQIALKSLTRMR